jgi:hypothetical protein
MRYLLGITTGPSILIAALLVCAYARCVVMTGTAFTIVGTKWLWD